MSEVVAVTGGAGFIGSHLVAELIRRGHKVVIIDDLSTGRIENIHEFVNEGRVEFVNASITDLELLNRLFRGVSYVFHQAAIPSVPRSIKDPLSAHNANVNGTLNVLLAARDNGVKKVVFASSSSVYGDVATALKSEDMVPNPLSPYAVTKMVGERYCDLFQKLYGLSTVIFRYFNVYGPRQNPDSEYAAVIPRFIKNISRGNSPVIYGDGEQSRDFTFVKDVVKANVMAVNNDVSGLFNVGRGESITVNRLASLVMELMKVNLKSVYEQPRIGDVKHSMADISRARAFGYNPGYSLKDGLKETIEGFEYEK
ncbi:SDR family oxidoreductase [Chloroflexota bacterium]